MHTNKIKFISFFLILTISWLSIALLINDIFFHTNKATLCGHYEPKVFVTPHGECYHSIDCNYISTIAEIGLYQAELKGYRACKHCSGVASDEIWIKDVNKISTFNYLISFASSALIVSIFCWIFVEIKYNAKKEID